MAKSLTLVMSRREGGEKVEVAKTFDGYQEYIDEIKRDSAVLSHQEAMWEAMPVG